MYGFPLDISKKLLKDLIGNLRQTDMFNVLLFAGGSTLMSEHSLPATAANIQKAINVIEHQQGGGGTELLPALKRALGLPRPENFSRTIVMATDGYVTVEEQAFDLIRNNLGNANMFAFGIGSSVNRHIIEGMAHVGLGEPFVITKPEEAPARAEAFRKLIQSPVLTQIKVNFGDFETYDVEPHSIPDVLADRPIILFGKWRGKPRGTITISGISGNEDYKESIEVSSVKPAQTNAALQYLWARQRIMLLSDYNMLRPDDERVKEVTNLGLTYNLLTAYTSFVAIDSEVRNTNGNATTVNQPLPLPQGVSDYAVGGVMRSAAMPASPGGYAVNKSEAKMAYELSQDAAVGPKKKDGTRVTSYEINATGGLTKEAVQGIIKQHQGDIEKCLASQAPGKLVITFNVNADGKIKNVRVSPKNNAVKQCIIAVMKNWKFPGASNETEVTITLMVNG
jgi:Ca-activated chloride channel family protein